MVRWDQFAGATAAGLVALAVGCAKPANVTEIRPAIEPYLDALERANAKGQLEYHQGGSPFSAGQKLTFFLGPENLTISFKGQVDFTRSSREARDRHDSSRPDAP